MGMGSKALQNLPSRLEPQSGRWASRSSEVEVYYHVTHTLTIMTTNFVTVTDDVICIVQKFGKENITTQHAHYCWFCVHLIVFAVNSVIIKSKSFKIHMLFSTKGLLGSCWMHKAYYIFNVTYESYDIYVYNTEPNKTWHTKLECKDFLFCFGSFTSKKGNHNCLQMNTCILLN